MTDKTILRALSGETLPTPPIWMMRQAGRYLPEYRATRAQAGDFLSLCYNSDLATEVTLQPIRRFGFDAAILFADILLVPQALGADLWFVTGEGPRLSTITNAHDLGKLGSVDDIHETLSPIYQTVRNLSSELPSETTLIGFAGAPWTVATYMIAGRGTPDQAPALTLMRNDSKTFDALMDLITDATISYLSKQIEAGAEVVKLFDSWSGALSTDEFAKYATAPTKRIMDTLRAAYPEVKLIGFPKGASNDSIIDYANLTGVDAVAIGADVSTNWAADHLQPVTCVQGNLDQTLMVTGGTRLDTEVRRIKETLSGGAHIFNLGHGVTPDANPDNVARMIEVLRA